ncbi:hypothetical protein NPS70_16485 [Streptomyces sp. C10-9-1]|uniref:deoxynucleotide monophosphate kinase family protein n=1 Tax=Streptomyces sp. C10-9-1 TaxID=1859285 RepID=UPI002112A7B2|nr:hypothetical protein [Streptomyces sp. C10-9-1]MCQ6554784.1 hypothetical protein [Streptomyces sp. C10-9-1]
MGNIGIIGRARVGKDTVGQWLVENRGYRRIAFADPLKEAALRLDPITDHRDDEVWDIVYGEWELVQADTVPVRLSTVVADLGWERAKEASEVRRILQELGASIRAIDEDFWLRAAMARVQEANEQGVPAVITDVRYPNEAASLRRAGVHLVYVDRHDVPHLDHESEGALTAADADHFVHNAGDVAELHLKISAIYDHVERVESRRHASRVY